MRLIQLSFFIDCVLFFFYINTKKQNKNCGKSYILTDAVLNLMPAATAKRESIS